MRIAIGATKVRTMTIGTERSGRWASPQPIGICHAVDVADRHRRPLCGSTDHVVEVIPGWFLTKALVERCEPCRREVLDELRRRDAA